MKQETKFQHFFIWIKWIQYTFISLFHKIYFILWSMGYLSLNVSTIQIVISLSFKVQGSPKWEQMSSEIYWENNVWFAGFLIDRICVKFGDKRFRQEVGIPMFTNCAPLLADRFVYASESEVLFVSKKKSKQ